MRSLFRSDTATVVMCCRRLKLLWGANSAWFRFDCPDDASWGLTGVPIQPKTQDLSCPWWSPSNPNLPPNPRLPRSSLSFSLHSQSPFLQPSPHRSISPPPPFPLPLSSSSRSSSLLLKFTQIHRRLHQRYAARPSSTTPNFTITHAANQTCLTSSQPLCTSSLGPPDQDSWSAFAFKASPNSSACT